jgi:hypothetical protein
MRENRNKLYCITKEQGEGRVDVQLEKEDS